MKDVLVAENFRCGVSEGDEGCFGRKGWLSVRRRC